jgi:chromosome segregation ATPase
VVRDIYGNVLDIKPLDIVRGAEVYGQHEISELTKSPEKLTLLLERFVKRDPLTEQKKDEFFNKLANSRQDINRGFVKLQSIEEQLSRLPALEETLKRYKDAGLEEKLKEQSHLIQEETVLKAAYERIGTFRDLKDGLDELLPINTLFLSPDEIKYLPAKDILSHAKKALDEFSVTLQEIIANLDAAIENVGKALGLVQNTWNDNKVKVNEEYEKILRDLQKEKIDGVEFIQLKEQIGKLTPLKEQKKKLDKIINDQIKNRKTLLAEWEDLKNEEFQALNRAAKKVSKQLAGRVRVQVSPAGSLEPLFQFLKEKIGGRLAESIETLNKRAPISLIEFASACQSGRDDLVKSYGLPPSQAERLADADQDILFQVEELDLPTTTSIELNVAAEGKDAYWQELSQLSTGQKATAVLLLLLLESDAPLVVDQPVGGGVNVKRVAGEKCDT